MKSVQSNLNTNTQKKIENYKSHGLTNVIFLFFLESNSMTFDRRVALLKCEPWCFSADTGILKGVSSARFSMSAVGKLKHFLVCACKPKIQKGKFHCNSIAFMSSGQHSDFTRTRSAFHVENALILLVLHF